METAESGTTVLESHATDKRAVGQEGNVHGGEGQESVHDIWSFRTNTEKTGESANVPLIIGR